MRPRIAIPVPHSANPKYDEKSFPQYASAVQQAGGDVVQIPLDQPGAPTAKLIETCDGVLLPGSPADVDPATYGQQRHRKTAPADARRDAIDARLLDDAYRYRKPVFGICYGLQSLNVYCAGSLVQHIASKVKHDVGKQDYAHDVRIAPGSLLANIIAEAGANPANFRVNSSHHQSADGVGKGLRIVSHCLQDGIVEAVEGTEPDHFVLAVQWHPERSVSLDEPSRALFRKFVEAAAAKKR